SPKPSEVVVCPSTFEGFGLTPMEAIATAAPVVASDIPPHREFLGASPRYFTLGDDDGLDVRRGCESVGIVAERHLATVHTEPVPHACRRRRARDPDRRGMRRDVAQPAVKAAPRR